MNIFFVSINLVLLFMVGVIYSIYKILQSEGFWKMLEMMSNEEQNNFINALLNFLFSIMMLFVSIKSLNFDLFETRLSNVQLWNLRNGLIYIKSSQISKKAFLQDFFTKKDVEGFIIEGKIILGKSQKISDVVIEPDEDNEKVEMWNEFIKKINNNKVSYFYVLLCE